MHAAAPFVRAFRETGAGTKNRSRWPEPESGTAAVAENRDRWPRPHARSIDLTLALALPSERAVFDFLRSVVSFNHAAAEESQRGQFPRPVFATQGPTDEGGRRGGFPRGAWFPYPCSRLFRPSRKTPSGRAKHFRRPVWHISSSKRTASFTGSGTGAVGRDRGGWPGSGSVADFQGRKARHRPGGPQRVIDPPEIASPGMLPPVVFMRGRTGSG